jgi:ABC-type nitrate/sulfonate/bicarbonate transport system substrate-binding protein
MMRTTLESNRRRARSAVFIGLLLTVLIATILFTACTGTKTTGLPASTLQRVTIGIQVSPAMTLLMAAKDKGIFREEGLDVELKEFTAGKFALQAFLSGAIDYAVSGEVPVCLATLQGNQIRVVAQMVESTTNEVRLVALKDASASDPKTYFSAKRRKLATSFGGGPEFFTYSFLRRYGIDNNSVEILSQKPEDMPATLETRSVDAIAIFDPFAFIAEKRIGSAATTFSDSTLYSELYVLNARPDQITSQARVIEAILRSVDRAATFVASDPGSAKQILQKYTKLDRAVIDGIWPNFTFRPALTSKLIDYWNAEAIWARDTGKVPIGMKLPDFRGVVESSFLKKVKPAAVQM